MSEQAIGYGYTDDSDEALKSKSFLSFGLNQGAKVTKFEFNPNGGKDGAASNCIDLFVQIGEREQRLRIYEVTKVFDKNNSEITDRNSDAFIKGFNALQIQNNAVVTHILKAFRTEEDIKAALSTPLSSFADWAKVATSLMPAGYQNMPVDVFLEYQYSIQGDNDRTWTQLPRNMKGGHWICRAQEGTFKEVRTETGGLKYVNENNVEHPFTRDANFMDSPKANQQVEGEGSAAITNTQAAPAKSSW